MDTDAFPDEARQGKAAGKPLGDLTTKWGGLLELLAQAIGASATRLVEDRAGKVISLAQFPVTSSFSETRLPAGFDLAEKALSSEGSLSASNTVAEPPASLSPGASAYLGEPIHSPVGTVFGVLEAFWSQPISVGFSQQQVMRAFAASIEADLQGYMTRSMGETQDARTADAVLSLNPIGLFDALLALIPNPAFYEDDHRVLRGCNEVFVRAMGRPRVDLIGKTMSDILPDAHAVTYNEIANIALRQRAVYVAEAPFPHASLGGRDVQVHLAPLNGHDGHAAGLMWVLLDVTERKRPERSVWETRRFLSSLFDSIQDGILAIASDHTILRANRAIYRLTGSLGSLEGRKCYEVISGKQACCPDCMAQHVFQDGKPQRDVHIFHDASGRARILELHMYPVVGPEGRIEAVLETVRDITEQRQAETALRASEEKYRAVIEGIEDGYYEVDLQGRFVFFNEPLCRLLNCLPLELLGHSYEQFEFGETGLEVRCAFRRVLRLGTSVKAVECTIARKDGTTAHLDLSISLVHDDDGLARGFRGIVRDVTARKHDERLRRRMEAQVHHAQKLESLGVMAGGIAHDFNNILMGILGNVDLALIECENPEAVRECMTEIHTSALRAAHLVSQMVAYSGQGAYFVQQMDLTALVETVRDAILGATPNVNVTFHLADGLPPIEADESQMRQMLLNLVVNAAEATLGPDGNIVISTGAMEVDRRFLRGLSMEHGLTEGPCVYIEVADSGSGMDPLMQSRMFEPFFTTKFAGRGLGLSAVLGIVRAHRGAIRVLSSPGEGTSVRVCFPIPGGAKKHDPKRSSTSAPESLRGVVVLVVDDEESIRSVTRRTLEKMGCSVFTARDGREAIEIYRLRSAEIAAVILDLIMPEMSGEETLKAIRAIRPDVRVILSSGYSEEDIEQYFHGAHVSAILHKPYGASDVMETLCSVLDLWEPSDTSRP